MPPISAILVMTNPITLEQDGFEKVHDTQQELSDET